MFLWVVFVQNEYAVIQTCWFCGLHKIKSTDVSSFMSSNYTLITEVLCSVQCSVV